jgi:hypothetical protein
MTRTNFALALLLWVGTLGAIYVIARVLYG